ncbi:unnamed protein product, partial [Meganyctiphanes norvegica]
GKSFRMDSEDYFSQMYEHNGAYDNFHYSRAYPMPYGEKTPVCAQVIGTDTPIAGVNNETAATNIQQSQQQPQQQYHHQQQQQYHHQQQQQKQQQSHEQQLSESRQQQQNHEQQLYKCNECGSSWANLKTLWMHQRKHLNPLVAVTTPPKSKIYENEPTISRFPVSSPMDLEYTPDNSITIAPVNTNKYHTTPQSTPEMPKMYPPPLQKAFNPVSPKISNPQLDLGFDFQHLKSYNQESTDFFLNSKRMETELKSNDEEKMRVHSETLVGVKSNTSIKEPLRICNPPLDIESIITQHSKSYTKISTENRLKLIRAESKLRSKEEKSSEKIYTMPMVNAENQLFNLQHSIFQNEVGTTQEFNAPEDSYIDNKDNSCPEEKIEKNTNHLVKKQEQDFFSSELPGKKCRSQVQERRKGHDNVKDYTHDQESESEDDNVIGPLVDATTPIVDVIRWFQDHKLLKSKMKCDRCENLMTWKTDKSDEIKRNRDKGSVNWTDGVFWQCENRICPNFCTKSIRAGSFFAKSKISLPKWFDIMFLWSKHVGAKATSDQVKLSQKAIIGCYSFFREVCELYFKSNPIKLGGPGITIEIDVSCFSEKRKRNHRPVPQPPIWVLGIVDTNSTPSIGYMEIVETKDAVTLLPIIVNVVLPGSIILVKDWKAYRKIQGLSDSDGSVKHTLNFVDVNNCFYKQTIESYWKKHKNYLTAMRGTRRSNLNSHLQEFMWRERFSADAVENLCEQIADQYSDDSFINNSGRTCLGEDTEKQKDYLDEKWEENTIFIQQENNCIFQDCIKQEPIDLDSSYIDSTDGSCSGDEIEKHMNYLDAELQENINCLGVSSKICPSIGQEGKQYSNKVKDCSEDFSPELESDNIILSLINPTIPIVNVVRWLQQYKLLKSKMKCDRCKCFMVWKTDNSDKNWADGFFWRCENKNCLTFNCTKSIRAESFFARSKLCLKKWLDIIYQWSKHVGAKATSDQVNFCSKMSGNCYSLFREVCESYFKANPIKLGGPGITIQIDVSCFSQKRKRNHGCEAPTPSLVLGIIDTTCTPSIGYMEIVETRDVATLFPIILKVVQPESIIHSKEWRAFSKIQGLSNMESTVDHMISFIEVDSSEHKQKIEAYWRKHKSYLTAMKGTKRSCLNSYLQEFMWRERFSDNALNILCEQIADQYSDSSYIDKTDRLWLGKEVERQESYLEVKLQENANISEEPPDKCPPRVTQSSHSLIQDGIPKELSTLDASYIDNLDESCSGDEIENHMNCLE